MKFLIFNFQFSKRLSVFILVLFFLFVALPVWAVCERIVPCGPGTDKPNCELCDLFIMLKNIIDCILIGIIPPLAVLMLVIAGAMFIISYFSEADILPGDTKGGPALLGQAKKLVTAVVIGLIIIYSSWLLIGTFFSIIGVAEWTHLQNWLEDGFFQIEC